MVKRIGKQTRKQKLLDFRQIRQVKLYVNKLVSEWVIEAEKHLEEKIYCVSTANAFRMD